MELSHDEKIQLMHTLNWDNTTSYEDMLDIIEGRKEGKDPVWGFNRKNLFVRSLERLPWHYMVALWGVETMKQMYSPEINRRIWPPSRREYFDRAFKLLRGETLPSSGWGTPPYRSSRYRFFSTRGDGNKQGVLSS
jgi:hypothetical protein